MIDSANVRVDLISSPPARRRVTTPAHNAEADRGSHTTAPATGTGEPTESSTLLGLSDRLAGLAARSDDDHAHPGAAVVRRSG